MKRVIVVYGNVASGKSTVSKLVAEALSGYKVVNLDKCRVDAYIRQLGNGPVHRDLLAQDMCLKQMTGPALIYETTAVTQFYKKASIHLRANNYQFVFVRLECSPTTSLARYYNRKRAGHLQAPFAYNGGKTDIQQAVYYFADEQRALKADLRFDTEKETPEVIVRAICDYVVIRPLRAVATG